MRVYFGRERSLLKVLLTVAAEAIHQVIRITYGKLQMGLVYTCHTFGWNLVFKPHVYAVVIQGGWAKTETGWLLTVFPVAGWLPSGATCCANACTNCTRVIVGYGLSSTSFTKNDVGFRPTPIVSIPKVSLRPRTSDITWVILH